MATIDSSVLDYWADYDAVYPLNNQDRQAQQHARQCVMLWQIYGAIMATNGVQVDPVNANDFLPEHLRHEVDTMVDGQHVMAQLKAGLRL